jgi:ribosomal protein S8
MRNEYDHIIFLLKNATLRKRSHVNVPHSSLANQLIIVLKKTGFIRSFQKIIGKKKVVLKVLLKYNTELKPAMKGLTKISIADRKYSLKKSQVRTVKNSFCLPLFSRHSKDTFSKFGCCLFVIK